MSATMPWSGSLIQARRTITGRLVLRHVFRRMPFWFAPVAAILFGGILLLPGDTFALSPAWAVLKETGGTLFGPAQAENGWGAVIAGLGLLHFVSVLLAGTRLVPLLTLWAIAIVFAGIAASFALSVGIASTGTGQYALNSLMAAWAYVYWES